MSSEPPATDTADIKTEVPASTPSPPLAAVEVTAPAAAEEHPNPDIRQLQQLFPETTADVLEAVLEAGGNLESATELLLSMNDPTYEPEAVETQQSQNDEEYARSLMREEEERARQEHERRSASRRSAGAAAAAPQTRETAGLAYQPYTPRRRGPSGAGNAGLAAGQQGPHQGGEGEKDELDQLTEQFSKFAEQGKKTFGTLFGKAKEQFEKLNETINAQVGPSQGGSAPSPPPKHGNSGWTPPSALPRPGARQSIDPTVIPERLPRPTPASNPSRDAPLPAVPTSTSTIPPPPTPAPASTSTATPSASETTAPEVVSKDEEPKKDFSKIGLLPRQSVSLLEKKKDTADDSDDDDLEYVRSPFDDD